MADLKRGIRKSESLFLLSRLRRKLDSGDKKKRIKRKAGRKSILTSLSVMVATLDTDKLIYLWQTDRFFDLHRRHAE